MPANMKKAGMKYQKGGSKKKKTTKEELIDITKQVGKKVDDKLESITGGGINKIPGYKETKRYLKNVFGMKHGGQGPKASNYIGNPMGYFNDKAMYGKEQMAKKLNKKK